MNQLKRRAPRKDWRDDELELTDAGHWVANWKPYQGQDFRDFHGDTLDAEYAKIQRGEAH